jgi:hypothetical protein
MLCIVYKKLKHVLFSCIRYKPRVQSEVISETNPLYLHNYIIMFWTQKQVSLLIESYEQHPCLYAVKRVAYKNRHARNGVLEEIRKQLAKIRPETTVAEIKTKFGNLRTI